MDNLSVDAAASKPVRPPAAAAKNPRAAARKRAPIVISDDSEDDDVESVPSSNDASDDAASESEPESDATPVKPQRPKAAAARKPRAAAAAPPPPPADSEPDEADSDGSEQSEPESPMQKPKAAARKPRAAGPAVAAKAAPAKRKPRVTKVLEDDDEDEQAAVTPLVAPQVTKFLTSHPAHTIRLAGSSKNIKYGAQLSSHWWYQKTNSTRSRKGTMPSHRYVKKSVVGAGQGAAHAAIALQQGLWRGKGQARCQVQAGACFTA